MWKRECAHFTLAHNASTLDLRAWLSIAALLNLWLMSANCFTSAVFSTRNWATSISSSLKCACFRLRDRRADSLLDSILHNWSINYNNNNLNFFFFQSSCFFWQMPQKENKKRRPNINELNARPLEWKCKCAIPPDPFFITRVHVLAKLNLMIIIVWELWPTCNGSGLALWHCRSCPILWLWRQCWNSKWVPWLPPCCLQLEKIVNEFS